MSNLNPFLGVALLKMAKLSWYMEKEEEAKCYISEAKRIIDITHGPSSPFALHEVFTLAKEISFYSKDPKPYLT